jgi:hypothetical protein
MSGFKKGDKVWLKGIVPNIGQDHGVHEFDFGSGKEFEVAGLLPDRSLELMAEGFGAPGAYGNGRLFVTYEQLGQPTADDYLAGHKASGIQVGDWVKVKRKAESNKAGWALSWMSPEMDFFVGETFQVKNDDGPQGFALYGVVHGRWDFPYFVLEKVLKPTQEDWKPEVGEPARDRGGYGQRVMVRGISNGWAWISDGQENSGWLVRPSTLRPISPEPPVKKGEILKVVDSLDEYYGPVVKVESCDKHFLLRSGGTHLSFDWDEVVITHLVEAKP